ncbi:hypothetical protein NPIL_413821 [Nephila pilipes]|uniref:Uncharacterized protein n=1 Tax=Nephila pilipes TaxID=299642 RepID=A0A8X6U4Z5_NEPPI|nr:hypothetical protein NPIL_413821 [Nephila pilipes]
MRTLAYKQTDKNVDVEKRPSCLSISIGLEKNAAIDSRKWTRSTEPSLHTCIMQSPEVSTVMTHRPISSYKIAHPFIYPPSHNQQPLQPPQSFLFSLTKQTLMTDENYAL